MDLKGREHWLSESKKLPQGKRERVQCCGSDKSRIIEHLPDRYVSNCFRPDCGNYVQMKTGMERLSAQKLQEAKEELRQYRKPKDTIYDVSEFPPQAVAWLGKAGLHHSLWRKYGFGYSAKLNRVIIPIRQDFNEIGVTCRALTKGDIKYLMYANVKYPQYVLTGESNTCIITEDILSCIRVKEAVPEHTVICILGTGVSDTKVQNIVGRFDKLIIWLDGDNAGVVATEKWKRRVQAFMEVQVINIDGKDPKDLTDKEIINVMGATNASSIS